MDVVESSIKVTIIWYWIASIGAAPARINPGKDTIPKVLAESMVGSIPVLNESRMISREDGRNPAAVGGNTNHPKVILCEGMYRMAFLLAQINFLIPSQFICNDFSDFFAACRAKINSTNVRLYNRLSRCWIQRFNMGSTCCQNKMTGLTVDSLKSM